VVSLFLGLLLSANGIGLMLSAALSYGVNGTGQRLNAGPGAVAWMTFFAVVLSLLATLAGAALGRRRAAARLPDEIK
jgi:hypothetical protein